MSMFDCKYALGDKIKIRELTTMGRIISIWIVTTGVQYEVRYFMDGKAQKEYFYEDELEAA